MQRFYITDKTAEFSLLNTSFQLIDRLISIQAKDNLDDQESLDVIQKLNPKDHD